MKSAAAIIDKILADHNTIEGNSEAIQSVTNDVCVASALKTASAGLSGHDPRLRELESLLSKQASILNKHFAYEETGVLYLFHRDGNKYSSEAFSALLLEHETIRNRFEETGEEILAFMGKPEPAKLASLNDKVTALAELLETHAAKEDRLLRDLKAKL
jgi:hypothetical protein